MLNTFPIELRCTNPTSSHGHKRTLYYILILIQGGSAMTTKDQEMESLEVEFEKQEAGVADLMEFYEKVEDIYVQASASASESRGCLLLGFNERDEAQCLSGARF